MMHELLKFLKDKTEDEAEHFTYRYFSNKKSEVDSLKVYGSYFRITLSQVYLRASRKWFTELYPAAHTAISIQHADYEPVELSHVSQIQSKDLSKGIELNKTVTGLIPWNGGTVEIHCGLVALKGEDYLNRSIKMLSSFSSLVAAPISQALVVAGTVASSVQDLMVGNDGKVHLNFHQTYTDTPGGNILKPGYYAAILATQDQLKDQRFSVEMDQLLADGKPFTGFDYLLFRIDGLRERTDWRMKDIQKNIDEARKAYLRRRNDEGDEFRTAAVVSVYDSPDLSYYDKNRVACVIREELEPFRSQALGAVSELDTRKNLDLEELMKSPSAMTWETAAKLGKPSLRDLFGEV